MPLIIPGIQSSLTGDKTQDWQSKLLGKKLGDSSDQVTFPTKELPSNHRVVEEGGMMTRDYQSDRLNIHLGKDGSVSKVTHG